MKLDGGPVDLSYDPTQGPSCPQLKSYPDSTIWISTKKGFNSSWFEQYPQLK